MCMGAGRCGVGGGHAVCKTAAAAGVCLLASLHLCIRHEQTVCFELDVPGLGVAWLLGEVCVVVSHVTTM